MKFCTDINCTGMKPDLTLLAVKRFFYYYWGKYHNIPFDFDLELSSCHEWQQGLWFGWWQTGQDGGWKDEILACHSSVTSTVSVNDSQAGAHDRWLAAGKWQTKCYQRNKVPYVWVGGRGSGKGKRSDKPLFCFGIWTSPILLTQDLESHFL